MINENISVVGIVGTEHMCHVFAISEVGSVLRKGDGTES